MIAAFTIRKVEVRTASFAFIAAVMSEMILFLSVIGFFNRSPAGLFSFDSSRKHRDQQMRLALARLAELD